MILLYRCKPIKVGYHSTKFGSHRHSDSRDLVVLFCQAISQDRVIKGTCAFIDKSPLR